MPNNTSSIRQAGDNNIAISFLSSDKKQNLTIDYSTMDQLADVPMSLQDKQDLNAYITDNLNNGYFDIVDSSSLSTSVKSIINDWLANNRASVPLEHETAINNSELFGMPKPNLSTVDRLNGKGSGKAYDPNINKGQKPTSAEELTRQAALASRARLLGPNTRGESGNSAGTLVDTLSSADLSVFFLVEMPKMEDINKGLAKHLYRKEILLFEIDSVLSASYSIMREVFPVRSIGSSKPKSFVRGPVTISGHLAFTIFTEDVLTRLRTQMQTEINSLQTKAQAIIGAANIVNKQAISDGSESVKSLMDTYRLYNRMLNTGGIFMLNQLLPFNILMMGTTERGTFAKMLLKNIRVIDENQMQGIQQPNIINRISFVAEDIFPLMSGNLGDNMSYTATAVNDQNNIGSNQFSVYTGSQLMRDISSMTSQDYTLGGDN